MKNYKELIKDLQKSIILVIVVAVAAYIVINAKEMLSGIGVFISYFTTLFVGIAIAYILNIIMTFLEGKFKSIKNDKNFFKKNSRGVSLVLSLIIVIVALALILTLVIPELINSLLNLIEGLPTYTSNLINGVNGILEKLKLDTINVESSSIEEIFMLFGLDYNQIISNLSSWVVDSNVVGFVSNFASGFLNFFVSVMIAIYLLMEKEYFIHGFKKVLLAVFGENVYEKLIGLGKDGNQIMADFIGGKGIECIVVGLLVYIPMLICGLPYASICGVLCGFFTLIPVFGSIIATVICGILLLSVDPWGAVIYIIIYQVVQFLDGNLIYPKFISKSLGLSPVWILTSVMVGGSAFGFIGFIIAVPVASFLYLLFTRLINNILAKKNLKVE